MQIDDLRTLLGTLRDQLHADLAQVSVLRPVQRRRSEVDRLVADLDRQLERIHRAAVITLVGATGAGKSTLLNALVGQRIAVEGVDRPTTRQPVIYAPRDADVSALLNATAQQAGETDSDGSPRVVRYGSTDGPWTGQVLVDAPDLNSVDAQHRATVSALADRSDVLVVVLHHQSVVEAASVSFVDMFAERRRLLFVLNRADELSGEARAALLAQARELAANRWHAPDAPVVSVSARAAQQQPQAEGWAELCLVLHDMVRDSAIGGIRRLNALGTAARLQALFSASRVDARDDLSALPDEAAAGLEQLQARCAEEVATRLALRDADLSQLLWWEAAKRWDGPGGWALHAGGLASLGVGAGATLVARRPLLAAGAAAGALAADQVQRALRERRMADVSVLMPPAGEFATWYSEALSSVRVRAGRLVAAPQSLGLPSPEVLHAALGSAVEEAWSSLVARDLPAAAERSVLRFFRVLLDLPVYGLGAWVVYQIGRGFLRGEYVGVDFVVNAVLLLAAYLFAVRVAVRRALTRRARRLLQEVIARTKGMLDTQSAEEVRSLRETALEQRTTLDRLCALEEHWRAALQGR